MSTPSLLIVNSERVVLVSAVGPQGATGDITPAAAAAQTAAAESATNAAASAATANTQAEIATTKAGQASGYATNASGFASAAAGSAGSASGHASTATTQAGIATTKAGEAAASVASIAGYSGSAASSSYEAQSAQGYAENAASSADNSATTATDQAGIATTQAGLASGFAQTATDKAQDATTQAGNAATSASDAQNYATGAAGVLDYCNNVANAASQSASDAGAQSGYAAGSAYDSYISSQNSSQSEQNAYTSEQNASGSASTATTQAGIALTQAGIANTQAGLAAGSASAASASATAAINAIVNQFKGGIAGASVPATSTTAGDYYQIISVGTSQSKTWAIGDRAIYNGTSGSWTQQPAAYLATPSSLGLPGLNFTGQATPISIPNSTVYAFGTDDLGFTLRLTLADYTPAANIILLDKVAANIGIRITLLTTGILRVQIGNGTNLTTYQYDSTVGVQTIVSDGQPAWIDLDLGRAGNATFSVNGLTLGSSVSISAASAQTLTSSAPLRLLSDGTTHYSGAFHCFYPRNVCLSAAARTALYLGGPAALPHYVGGCIGASAQFAGAFANDNFAIFTGNTATGFSATQSTGQGNGSWFYDNFGQSGPRLIGSRIRIRFDANITGSPIVAIGQDFSADATGNTIVSGANTVNLTLTSAAIGNRIRFRIQDAGSLIVSNATIDLLGFLGIYDASNCTAAYQLPDTSPIGLDATRYAAPASLASNPRNAKLKISAVHTGTNSDIQLLGQNCINGTRRWRIDSVQVTTSAATNVSLGINAGASSYIATQAVTGTTDIATFVTRLTVSGQNNFYSRSSAAATLLWVINLVSAD